MLHWEFGVKQKDKLYQSIYVSNLFISSISIESCLSKFVFTTFYKIASYKVLNCCLVSFLYFYYFIFTYFLSLFFHSSSASFIFFCFHFPVIYFSSLSTKHIFRWQHVFLVLDFSYLYVSTSLREGREKKVTSWKLKYYH